MRGPFGAITARLRHPERGEEAEPEEEQAVSPAVSAATTAARSAVASDRDHLPSDPSVAVPVPVRIAASWSWRVLVIVAAVLVVGYGLTLVSELVIPLLVALLLTALFSGAVDFLSRWLPRAASTGIVMVVGLAVIAGAISLVVQQVTSNYSEMSDQVRQGVDQVHTWLAQGPLQVTDSQIQEAYDRLKEFAGSSAELRTGLLNAGVTIGHIGAGLVLALFSTFFFLYQGGVIWDWVVRLFPRLSRDRVESSGRVGFTSLTAYVRATVLVALVDAIGITIVALILRVPFAPAIGVLVFITAFIPIVGALASGIIAVLLALVSHGLWSAVIMAAGVLLVQQVESHVLQPFLMGRLVKLHPLAIIFSISTGAVLFGIVGALFAVPVAAFTNAVVNHLAGRDTPEMEAAENRRPRREPPLEDDARDRAPAVVGHPDDENYQAPETD